CPDGLLSAGEAAACYAPPNPPAPSLGRPALLRPVLPRSSVNPPIPPLSFDSRLTVTSALVAASVDVEAGELAAGGGGAGALVVNASVGCCTLASPCVCACCGWITNLRCWTLPFASS